MTREVSIRELRTQLSDVLSPAMYAGERIGITRNGMLAAIMVSGRGPGGRPAPLWSRPMPSSSNPLTGAPVLARAAAETELVGAGMLLDTTLEATPLELAGVAGALLLDAGGAELVDGATLAPRFSSRDRVDRADSLGP